MEITEEKLHELSEFTSKFDSAIHAVPHERYVWYAMENGYDRKEADKMYSSIHDIGSGLLYLSHQQDRMTKYANLIPEAIKVLFEVYEKYNCFNSYIRTGYGDSKDKYKFFFEDENSDIKEYCVNMNRKDSIILFGEMLKNEKINIIGKAKFIETIDTNKEKVDIYEGDIIFVHLNAYDLLFDLYKVSDSSGVYICTDEGYRKLLYTQGKGYVDKGSTPNFDTDHLYNYHRIKGFGGQIFEVVGNIHKDISVLVDNLK